MALYEHTDMDGDELVVYRSALGSDEVVMGVRDGDTSEQVAVRVPLDGLREILRKAEDSSEDEGPADSLDVDWDTPICCGPLSAPVSHGLTMSVNGISFTKDDDDHILVSVHGTSQVISNENLLKAVDLLLDL